MTNVLLIVAVVVLVFQLVMFFVIRKQKRTLKENSIEDKYNIRNRSDAWKLINSPGLPEADRIKIEKLYNSMG
jgi:hypothetical protein